ESRNGKIVLRGSNGLSVASALNYFLKTVCFCDIGWNGTNLKLPATVPVIAGKIHKATPYQYRYYLNYCTFQYSMAWWDWDRWQKEIDWMALNGINMPLALTGEEAIWQKVYKNMGFTDKDLASFFSGPAYFSWLWMGNIDGWDGPLSQHWMDRQMALQKQILERERSLGMKPVLPAFTGHVPPAMKDKYPMAALKKTNWGAGFGDVYILDPNDPLFTAIGTQYLQQQRSEFGTDHFYSADTFNENVPPTKDSTFLDDMSKKVFQSMAGADPAAVWVMQGWMFHYNSDYWQPTQMKALLNAVPNDRMIILDLYSEAHPVWNHSEAYYGKPWIWNMLHNFGGNISLWGRMESVANDPANALHDPASGKMRGIGLTPEGIEQNPALYALMLENVWNDQPLHTDEWLADYVHRRYGAANDKLAKAWVSMKKTVYNGGYTEGGPESIIVARPTFNKQGHWARTILDYDSVALVHVWKTFVGEANNFQHSDGFAYDLVDITRQVLANYASQLQQKIAATVAQNDSTAFKKYSREFLELIDDMDNLLNTRTDFLMGKWIKQARDCGIDPAEKDLYELNARNVITLWGDKNSPLHEYSCRQWAGLLKGFYKPRWQQFFAYVDDCIKKGNKVDEQAFDNGIRDWEWKWVNSHEAYSATPTGNPVETAKKLYTKYINKVM
ncbi:MAG TPA: alpha-N-acetylglucosaminidase, partial [Niastella sp.]